MEYRLCVKMLSSVISLREEPLNVQSHWLAPEVQRLWLVILPVPVPIQLS